MMEAKLARLSYKRSVLNQVSFLEKQAPTRLEGSIRIMFAKAFLAGLLLYAFLAVYNTWLALYFLPEYPAGRNLAAAGRHFSAGGDAISPLDSIVGNETMTGNESTVAFIDASNDILGFGYEPVRFLANGDWESTCDDGQTKALLGSLASGTAGDHYGEETDMKRCWIPDTVSLVNMPGRLAAFFRTFLVDHMLLHGYTCRQAFAAKCEWQLEVPGGVESTICELGDVNGDDPNSEHQPSKAAIDNAKTLLDESNVCILVLPHSLTIVAEATSPGSLGLSRNEFSPANATQEELLQLMENYLLRESAHFRRILNSSSNGETVVTPNRKKLAVTSPMASILAGMDPRSGVSIVVDSKRLDKLLHLIADENDAVDDTTIVIPEQNVVSGFLRFAAAICSSLEDAIEALVFRSPSWPSAWDDVIVDSLLDEGDVDMIFGEGRLNVWEMPRHRRVPLHARNLYGDWDRRVYGFLSSKVSSYWQSSDDENVLEKPGSSTTDWGNVGAVTMADVDCLRKQLSASSLSPNNAEAEFLVPGQLAISRRAQGTKS